MKYAIFSDDLLSDFRLDDNGETLVLNDKRGYTRAVKLLPYVERPKGDLISREALKEFEYINKGNFNTVEGIREWIDNAPTVPLPDFKDGYKQAILDGKTNFSRPQGEWIKNEGKDIRDNFYTCSECGRTVNILCGETLADYPFCHCGADMRGEDECRGFILKQYATNPTGLEPEKDSK